MPAIPIFTALTTSNTANNNESEVTVGLFGLLIRPDRNLGPESPSWPKYEGRPQSKFPTRPTGSEATAST
jgi:hypothetical protein